MWCVITLCFGHLIAVIPQRQEEDDETRNLWDTEFRRKRPAGKPSTRRKQQVRYRPVGAPVTFGSTDAVVGVTIWRMRPSTTTDDQEVRQLVYEEGEWTPERINSDTPLLEGQRVQITIESPRAGYLYVFDRELYADKSLGEPYLIFPMLSINGGDNKVMAGRVVEVPSSEDKPPYYTLKRSRPDHEGEVLTVLVTDKPLAELTIGRRALKVSREQLETYEKKWGASLQKLELVGGADTPMTRAERAAGRRKALLTQADSLPQTIYRIRSKPGAPLLLTVPLRIGNSQSD